MRSTATPAAKVVNSPAKMNDEDKSPKAPLLKPRSSMMKGARGAAANCARPAAAKTRVTHPNIHQRRPRLSAGNEASRAGTSGTESILASGSTPTF